jgi:hypothetical protein
VFKAVFTHRCSGSYVMIINRDQTAGVPLPDLALNVGKTSIRPGNGHEWEAVIIRRRHRLYKIKISRRAHIGGSLQMSDDVYVQPGPIRYAITPAQRGGKRSVWSSDAIAATGLTCRSLARSK